MEEVGVYTTYSWECPECFVVNSQSYSPRLRETLQCNECQFTATCREISEDCRPDEND